MPKDRSYHNVKFSKSRPNSKVKVTESKMFPLKVSCITRKNHVKYQISLFKCYYMQQGKSFLKIGQSTRSRSQSENCWYSWKSLATTNVKCEKSKLVLTVQKLLARLQFSKNRSNSKVKVTRVEFTNSHGVFLPHKILM